jgi:hypothetical protein
MRFQRELINPNFLMCCLYSHEFSFLRQQSNFGGIYQSRFTKNQQTFLDKYTLVTFSQCFCLMYLVMMMNSKFVDLKKNSRAISTNFSWLTSFIALLSHRWWMRLVNVDLLQLMTSQLCWVVHLTNEKFTRAQEKCRFGV